MIAGDLGDPLLWARSSPAGWAKFINGGQWRYARHLALCDRLALELYRGDRIRNAIVSMPPRHGKSMYFTQALPGWWMGNCPTDEAIITSYAGNLATKFGRSVRDSLEEYGPEVFGIGVRHSKRAANDFEIMAAPGSTHRHVSGSLKAAGVGGPVTGRGGDLIIIDDPFKDARQAMSEAYRDALWDWYLSTLFTRSSPKTRKLVIMTRWHEDDLVGRLLARADEQNGDKWYVLNLPALATGQADPLGREEGEALWPEQWSAEALRNIRDTQTSYWWSAMYQGRPSPAEGNIFKREWFGFWQPAGANLGPVRLDGAREAVEPVTLPSAEETLSSWDLTFDKGQASAYVTGQKWIKAKGNVYLTDQRRDRMNFPETVAAFRQFHERHPDIDAKLVENKANGPALIAQTREEIPGIIPVAVKGGKEERARGVSTFVESGNVYLPHPAVAPWVREYVDEMAAFPNSAFSDQVDSTTQALERLYRSEIRVSPLWGSRKR